MKHLDLDVFLFIITKKENAMDANTPLYTVILDFFLKNPGYKISADEFAGLVSMLVQEHLDA